MYLRESDSSSIVIKQLKRRRASASDLENVKQELLIMSSLDHSNIVQLKGRSRDEDYYYLMLEYCNGGTVAEMLNNCGGKLSELTVKHIALQLTLALDYLHREK